MNLNEIKTNLDHSDYQYWLKTIAALNDFDESVAVPLLKRKLHDPKFLVLSFVARGLGKQQMPNSFVLLLEMMKLDNTPNVCADVANSLSLFGEIAISHLVLALIQDEYCLVRRTILGALAEMDCPSNYSISIS